MVCSQAFCFAKAEKAEEFQYTLEDMMHQINARKLKGRNSKVSIHLFLKQLSVIIKIIVCTSLKIRMVLLKTKPTNTGYSNFLTSNSLWHQGQSVIGLLSGFQAQEKF